jgi:hypothetical protein
MLHLGIFFHDFGVFTILGHSREDEFVILLSVIVQNEADLFASAQFDTRGLEAHFSPPSNMLILMTRAGFFGSPGSPAEKCP